MKWLADECFDNDIVRGLFRRSPDFDLLRAQDIIEVAGHDDETLRSWAAKYNRAVLTHDMATIVPVLQRQPQRATARIVLVPDSLAIAQVIEDVLLIDGCSTALDWTASIIYLPLR